MGLPRRALAALVLAASSALAGCGAHAAAPARPASPVAPRSAFAERAPAGTRALFHVARAGALLVAEPGRAARALGDLAADGAACGLDVARDVGDVDGWVTREGALHAEIAGKIEPRHVACLAARHELERVVAPQPDGSVVMGPLRFARRAAGGMTIDGVDAAAVRAGSPAAVGASPALAARFAALVAGGAELGVVVDARTPPFEATLRRAEHAVDLALTVGARPASRAAAALTAALHADGHDARLDAVAVRAEGDRLLVHLDPTPELAMALRRGVVEAFKVPSGSMMPTLLVGDHVFVVKDVAGRVPARGDVVAFEQEPGQTFLKRVVGLPGDRVVVDGDDLRVNGAPVPARPEGEATFEPPADGEPATTGALFRETLGEHAYLALRTHEAGFGEPVDVTVPSGHVFVLGDNRHNSHDSRSFGPVPVARIRGRAVVVWMSSGPAGVRWERVLGDVD